MNRVRRPFPIEMSPRIASASNESGRRPHPPRLPVRSSGTDGPSPPRSGSLLVTHHGRLTAEGDKEKGEGGQLRCPPSPNNHFPLCRRAAIAAGHPSARRTAERTPPREIFLGGRGAPARHVLTGGGGPFLFVRKLFRERKANPVSLEFIHQIRPDGPVRHVQAGTGPPARPNPPTDHPQRLPLRPALKARMGLAVSDETH